MTEDHKKQIARVLAVGCPLETAAAFVSLPLDELHQEIESDPDFAANLKHNIAGVEVAHVSNVKNASKDGGNWRASVWWLEHCVPEHYGKHDPNAKTGRQFRELMKQVSAAIRSEVRQPADRTRLLLRVSELAGRINTTDSSAVSVDPSSSCDDLVSNGDADA